MFKSGDQVAEHLRLVRLLGAGGMGSVWVADHLRLRTQVAVKFLSTNLLNNVAARNRFDREAQLVAQVKSPHVVQVLDQGTLTDLAQPYIVMELLDGEDLGQLMARRKTLSVDEAYVILEQVCAGLHTAHGMGLVHRDIKPENIFLLPGDRPFVKILDFGIARATQEPELQRLTHTGGVIGTAHYMSPEQLFEGKQVDRRTDIWALGVVLYRTLTGRLPFDGSTYGDLCLAVHRGVFTPVSQLAALSPEIDAFMTRALATDRNTRFATAKEFAHELARFVQRPSLLPGVPIISGSLPGTVRASTGEPGYKPIGTGTEVLRPHTHVGTAVSVDTVPLKRSGVVAASAIAGAVVLVGVAIAAWRFWSANDGAPQAEAVPQTESKATAAAARPESPRERAPASMAPAPPASSVPTNAPAAPPEPSKAPPPPAENAAVGTKFKATAPTTQATATKPRTPSTSTSTSTSHDQAPVPPKAPETPATPAKEKYRGF